MQPRQGRAAGTAHEAAWGALGCASHPIVDSAQSPPFTGTLSAVVTVLHSEVSGRAPVLRGATRVGSTLPGTPASLLSFLLATRPGRSCRPNAHCETERALPHMPRGAHLVACLAGLARLRASHQHAKRTPRSTVETMDGLQVALLPRMPRRHVHWNPHAS